jgi:hypothetical protein
MQKPAVYKIQFARACREVERFSYKYPELYRRVIEDNIRADPLVVSKFLGFKLGRKKK